MSDLPETETKSEFAARCGVDPSAVSHWIKHGKIGPDALDGIGRRARIRVAVAQAQLRTRLDIGQRLGNGLTTRLTPPPAAAAPRPAPVAAPAPAAGPGGPSAPPLWPAPPPAPLPELSPLTAAADLVEERIKRERLAALERENRRKAEEEAERAGRYIEAAGARRQMGRVAKAVIEAFEGGLPQLANAMAERFEIPQRDVLHLLTVEMRKIRTRAAENARRQAEDMPRLIEDTEEGAEEG